MCKFNKDFFSVQIYKKYENKDCLIGNNLHYFTSNGMNLEDCMDWCKNNDSCGAFTEWYDNCYFKSKNCEDDIKLVNNAVLYIKQGI